MVSCRTVLMVEAVGGPLYNESSRLIARGVCSCSRQAKPCSEKLRVHTHGARAAAAFAFSSRLESSPTHRSRTAPPPCFLLLAVPFFAFPSNEFQTRMLRCAMRAGGLLPGGLRAQPAGFRGPAPGHRVRLRRAALAGQLRRVRRPDAVLHVVPASEVSRCRRRHVCCCCCCFCCGVGSFCWSTGSARSVSIFRIIPASASARRRRRIRHAVVPSAIFPLALLHFLSCSCSCCFCMRACACACVNRSTRKWPIHSTMRSTALPNPPPHPPPACIHLPHPIPPRPSAS